jgi:hypothetical protein
MGNPTAAEVKVATGALTTEAQKWDDNAPALTTINVTMAGMSLTRLEAGLFQIVYDAYEEVRAGLQDRAGEGASEFYEIGKTLRQVAKTYQDQDAAQEHAYRNLW